MLASLWLSVGFHMASLWLSFGFPLAFLLLSFCFPLDPLRISFGLFWLSLGCHSAFLWLSFGSPSGFMLAFLWPPTTLSWGHAGDYCYYYSYLVYPSLLPTVRCSTRLRRHATISYIHGLPEDRRHSHVHELQRRSILIDRFPDSCSRILHTNLTARVRTYMQQISHVEDACNHILTDNLTSDMHLILILLYSLDLRCPLHEVL